MASIFSVDTLKDLRNHALERVDVIINKYPKLINWASKRQFKKVQIFLEKNLSKMTKIDWVIAYHETNKAMMNAVAQVCEASELDLHLTKVALAMLALSRRMTVDTMANTLKGRFNNSDELFDFMQKIEDAGLVNKERGMYITNECFALNPEAEIELDCFQSNPCVVCKPNKARIRKSGKTENGYKAIHRSLWTKKADQHDEIPLDFINLQNANVYTINFSAWDEYIFWHPYVPERADNDSDAVWESKLKDAFRTHFKKTFIIELFRKLGVDQINILTQFDYRGRNYPIAYLFNTQGTDPDKALLGFRPRPISAMGIRWLAISIANCMNVKYHGKDIDKHVYDMRLKWYQEVFEPLLSLPFEEFKAKLWDLGEEADSACCFYVQAQNMWYIQEAIRKGKTPVCWVITHWDATASGYQFQSIFAGDWEMARLTNLVLSDSKERMDVYSVLYDRLIASGIPSSYSRNKIKKGCFIPAVYNSTLSIKECFPDEEHQKIFNKLMDTFDMWQLNRSFPSLWNPETTEYSFYLPDGFKVFKVNKVKVAHNVTFQDRDVTLTFQVPGTLPFSLELGPNLTHACDGFVARELARRLNFSKRMKKWIIALYNDESRWTRKEDAKGSRALMEHLLQLAENFQFYSFRIFKEITPANIDLVPDHVIDKLMELPACTCEVCEIHDSFGVHPDHVSALVGQYKMILHDLALSRYYPAIKDYLEGNAEGTTYSVPHKALAEAIMKSIYPLC